MERREDVYHMNTRPVTYVEASSVRGIAVGPLAEGCGAENMDAHSFTDR